MKRYGGNPYHDRLGRFCSGPCAGGKTVIPKTWEETGQRQEFENRRKNEAAEEYDRRVKEAIRKTKGKGKDLDLTSGCVVTIRPEWRDEGERGDPYVVTEAYNDVGRCRITPVKSRMTIKPVETVDYDMIEKKYDPREEKHNVTEEEIHKWGYADWESYEKALSNEEDRMRQTEFHE